MAGKDIIVARQKDLKRLYVIHKIIEGAVTQKRAAENRTFLLCLDIALTIPLIFIVVLIKIITNKLRV